MNTDLLVVVVTVLVGCLFMWGYFCLKPTVVLPYQGVLSQCPARWVLENGFCVPQYSTKCKAFKPDTYSNIQKCDIAQSCGTYWSGICV